MLLPPGTLTPCFIAMPGANPECMLGFACARFPLPYRRVASLRYAPAAMGGVPVDRQRSTCTRRVCTS